ncbi:MAG: hypothetical protein ABI806_04590 [Candidatus Solibacter sp.]
MMGRRYPLAAVYLAVLTAIQIYLAHNLFFADFTGHMNSLQGLWISMARLAGEHWFRPSWWPYQDGGVPFEHTYMPLIPATTALLAKFWGVPVQRAFYSVMGVTVCLGPLTLFVMVWRMSGAPGCAFWTSLIYSMTSPARALLPEGDVDPIRYWSSLRFYGSVVWDDLPHQTAICFLPLALLFLWRAMERRRPLDYVLTVAFMMLTVLPSVFGATGLMLGVACMLAALPRERLRSNLKLAAGLGLAAYLIVCPFLPPSLIATIRSNQQQFVEDRWSAASFIALGLVWLGCAAVWLLTRTAARHVRFFALFAWVAAAIPLLDVYAHSHFIPQPARYTAEMELGIALIGAPLLGWLWRHTPRKIAIAMAAFLLSLAAEHVGAFVQFTQEATRPTDVRGGIEYRMAQWVDRNVPGQRVMVPGSIAQWLNVFSTAPQLSGASFSTTPNWNQQDAIKSVLTCDTPLQVEIAVLWLKAFGAQAAAASGPRSPQFWRGNSSTKFDGLMPVLWRRDDTTIYRVPQRSSSLAHVIPAGAIAHRTSGSLPTRELRKYVAALDDVSLPLAEMRWISLRLAAIRASVSRGQVVSVQQCYHPGWHAAANGKSAPIRRDGLGFLLIEPRCDGPCAIELTYNGGWEYWLCRVLGLLTLAAVCAYAVQQARRAL